jgi:ketosteroid isomerase-like protein
VGGTEAHAVEAIVRDVYAAFAEHDPARIEAVQDENCTVWDVFTADLIVGRSGLAAFHEKDQAQSIARGPLSFRLSDFHTDVWSDTAVVRYLVHFSYEPPRALSGTVRTTDVFRRFPDGWRIVHHHEGLRPKALAEGAQGATTQGQRPAREPAQVNREGR